MTCIRSSAKHPCLVAWGGRGGWSDSSLRWLPRGDAFSGMAGMNRDELARTRGFDSQSSTPSRLSSHTHQIMEAFLWNNKSATRHEQKKHQEMQSLILSRLKRPDVMSHDEAAVRPSENGSWNHTVNINHRNHIQHREVPSQRYHSLSIQSENEEEDIVCCDGGHCREGTKNLCTIAIWAIIVFFVINRFFVHMAMHLHKTQNISPGGVRVVELGAHAIADVHLGPQPIANVTLLGEQGAK
jgi:hypothetical protein